MAGILDDAPILASGTLVSVSLSLCPPRRKPPPLTQAALCTLLQAEEALNAERDRVTSIMHHTSESAVLRVVEETLLEKHERALLDKAGSGCRVLLRNQKLDDLARM